MIIVLEKRDTSCVYISHCGSLHELQVQVIKKISIKRAHALYKLKIYITRWILTKFCMFCRLHVYSILHNYCNINIVQMFESILFYLLQACSLIWISLVSLYGIQHVNVYNISNALVWKWWRTSRTHIYIYH